MNAQREVAHEATGLHARTSAAITDAVLEELAQLGYGRLSMGSIAKRARVGKSALYRRFPSKQAMVITLLSELSVPADTELPATGTLRGDLWELIHQFYSWLTDPRFATIIPDLGAEACRNPDFAEAYRQQIADPRRAFGAKVLQNAVARGELPADVNVDLALDLIAAPIYWQFNILHRPVGNDYIAELLDHVTRALRASES